MRRAVFAFAVVITTAVAVAPASAHEEINPSTFPTGRPTFFLLSAANEQKVDLVKVTVTAPDKLPFGATTKTPPGWTAAASEKVITYSGGSVKPDAWDQWGFEIDSADQPGIYTYKLTLGFADGKTDDVSVPVTAVAGAGATTGTTGAARSAPSSPVSAIAAIHTVRTRANAALVVGIIGAALALVALVVAVVRRGRSGSSAGGGAAPAGAKPDASGTQSW